MLVQQGFRPARTVVFERALGFVTAEARAIFFRLFGGSIALDAFPVSIEIDEIAQRSLRQSPSAERDALPSREGLCRNLN